MTLYAAFGRAVAEAMEDPRVVLVTCDTARDHCVYDLREKYPDRCIDCGIGEQHAVSMASALALSGMKPIVVTYSRFLTRAYEQIYNQVSEHTAVVYVGGLAGTLEKHGPGISHEALEDGEAMRGLGLVVSEPYSDEQVAYLLGTALARRGQSTYVRLLHVDDASRHR